MYTDQLSSKRLLTRKLTREDIPLWAEFFHDKEAVEFIPDFGLTTELERAEHWIERQLKRYAESRYGLQALYDITSGEFIGQCGLLAQEVDGKMETEVGYHILKKHWGKGYAPEAAKLFIDYAFQNGLTQSIISIIETKNIKSQRVAEKNGLHREKSTDWNEMNVYIYRIEKEDWKLSVQP